MNTFINAFSKRLQLCFLIALSFTIQLSLNAQVVVWEDNFDGTTLNPGNWTYDIGDGCDVGICGWGNAELEYYNPGNVKVENGNLVIEARKEAFGGKEFTSGRIKTQGKVDFKYGTLEARIKIPDLKNGLWPAFWTLGVMGLWPANGEIDIMELGGADSYPDSVNNWVSAACHWEYNGGQADYGLTYHSPTSLNDDYHIYKLVWTPAAIKVSIDDIEYYVIDISAGAANDLEEFHNCHYILLNLAVGGNYTGKTSPAEITATMPAQMLVDYIKLTYNPGDCIVLPVTLIDFSISVKDQKNVLISWTASNEENSDHYIIERSTDGTSFGEIGVVKSKGGAIQNNYFYTDNKPAEGVNYYRLVQVDKDGKRNTFNVKSVKFSKKNVESLTIFPNPLKGANFTLLFNEPVEKILNVQIVNLLGEVLLNANERPNGNVLSVSFGKKPAKGIYMIKVDGTVIPSKRLVVE